jgi:hypothetical protein
MRYLEIIKVRSSPGRGEQVNWTLHNLVSHIQKIPGLVSSHVCANAKIPGDWGLFLFWEDRKMGFQGSALALSLAQDLRAMGLVDHAVWMDQHL